MDISKDMLLRERDDIINLRDEHMRKVEQTTGVLLFIEFLLTEIDKEVPQTNTID